MRAFRASTRHARDHAGVVEAVVGVEHADAVRVPLGLDGLAVAEADRHVRDRRLTAETRLRLTGEVEEQRARRLQRLLHRHRRALLLEPHVLVRGAVGNRHAGAGRGPLRELGAVERRRARIGRRRCRAPHVRLALLAERGVDEVLGREVGRAAHAGLAPVLPRAGEAREQRRDVGRRGGARAGQARASDESALEFDEVGSRAPLLPLPVRALLRRAATTGRSCRCPAELEPVSSTSCRGCRVDGGLRVHRVGEQRREVGARRAADPAVTAVPGDADRAHLLLDRLDLRLDRGNAREGHPGLIGGSPGKVSELRQVGLLRPPARPWPSGAGARPGRR